MDLDYIKTNLTFDEEVEYKGIKIYPLTIKYYHIAKMGHLAFAINLINETDINLFGLPYMEYMFKKSLNNPDFAQIWALYNNILQLSFKDQIYSFKYEGDFLKLIVAVPTEKYNEEIMCVYREKLKLYENLSKDKQHQILNYLQLENLKEELDTLANELFTIHIFNDEEFEDIRKIICYMNDIDISEIDPKWEKELIKAREIIQKTSSNNEVPTFEDLANVVAMSLGKTPKEIQDMTVRRFDRYLTLELDKEDYLLCKQAELSGTEFKIPPKHWLKGYKIKGRYSDVQNNGNGMKEILK